MLLIVQALFALVASLRGWGFRPFGVLLTAVLVGLGLGLMGVYSVAAYLVVDFVFALVLFYMAVVRPEFVDA